ncbi:hypothetical protein [Pseudoclavibacter sp. VKM Ac-2888]|uniref:VG15 protein n=1 Tax=Pseudoclavibacter sp. VKM Ac-2888 TaxID=2783830 RepID=UPI00188DBA83|nr:hypothetical protein [Pseudoclavibacter sp. VKM Ac-2888]MBF4549678.1 hypothetical protein [Pseudoclavibacter sp. VKM Ac-2888]
MARTADGRALTEAHRLAQIRVGAQAEVAARALWPRLDVDDIDASVPMWMAANLVVAERQHDASVAMAAAYLEEYQRAEVGRPVIPAGADFDAEEVRAMLLINGPNRVKALINKGLTGPEAHAAAVTKYGGIVRRATMAGGRRTVDETARSDQRAVGWRRVTDGNPCTFCAMLASRGPIYGTQASTAGDVMRPTRGGGEGLRYHGHCGCTAEIVYGAWIPNESELYAIDEYQRAAAQVDALGLPRTERNILPLMRANGVFKDSPVVRNKNLDFITDGEV